MPKKMPKSPGRPRVDKDLQEARRLTRTEFDNIMTEYLSMSYATLNEIAEGRLDKPMLHRIVAAILKAALEQGDQKKLEFFIDRLVGPVPKEAPVNFTVNLQQLPEERVITLAKDAIKYLEENHE